MQLGKYPLRKWITMAAELSIRENIKKAILLGADLSSLDGARSWYRNGEKGHLHLDKYCYRLSDSYNAKIVSIKASETKSKICPICFSGNLIVEDFRMLESITILNKAYDYALKSAELLDKPISAAVAVRNLKVCLKNINAIESNDPLHDAIKKVTLAVTTALTQAQLSNAGSEIKISRHAALLSISGETAPESIHNLRVILGKNREELMYERLWQIWSSSVEEGENFEVANLKVLNEFKNASAISIKQLDYSILDLKNKLESPTDKSLKEILKEVWQEDVIVKLKEQITTWEELYSAQMNLSDLIVVSIPSQISTSDRWLSAVIGTWDLQKGNGNAQYIKLPKVIASWFVKEVNSYASYRAQAEVHQLLTSDNENTLLTALTLWSPDSFRNNEFDTFSKALTAARNI